MPFLCDNLRALIFEQCLRSLIALVRYFKMSTEVAQNVFLATRWYSAFQIERKILIKNPRILSMFFMNISILLKEDESQAYAESSLGLKLFNPSQIKSTPSDGKFLLIQNIYVAILHIFLITKICIICSQNSVSIFRTKKVVKLANVEQLCLPCYFDLERVHINYRNRVINSNS